MQIRTNRLVLKPFSGEDTEAALTILTDECIKKTYLLPDFAKKEDALPLFCRLMELSLDESHFVRGIYLEGRLIGFINDVGILDGCLELGYVMAPAHQGQGYMTEALRGSIEYLFRLGYREISAGAFQENSASIRVMVKAGMARTNKTEELEYRGEYHRCIYYSIRNRE